MASNAPTTEPAAEPATKEQMPIAAVDSDGATSVRDGKAKLLRRPGLV